jgi:hypothetical protein
MTAVFNMTVMKENAMVENCSHDIVMMEHVQHAKSAAKGTAKSSI